MDNEWNVQVIVYHGGHWVDEEYFRGEEISFFVA